MSAIFGRQSSYQDEITVPVVEGYDVEDNGDLIALRESFDDQLNIIQNIHAIDTEVISLRNEYDSLKESATEEELNQYVSETETVIEASIKDAWESIKKFFVNLWTKLKAFVETAIRYFDKLFRSSKSFIEKYEDQLRKLNLNGFTFKMFNYDKLDQADKMPSYKDDPQVKTLYDTVFNMTVNTDDQGIEKLRANIDSSKERKEETINGLRGAILGKPALTADQYRKELYSYFRGGARDTEDRKELPVKIDTIISVLKDSEGKKRIEEFEKKLASEFSDVLKKIDNLSKSFKNATPGQRDDIHVTKVITPEGKKQQILVATEARGTLIEGVRTLTTFVVAEKDIHMAYFRAWREAWAERDRTYRSVVMAAFSYSKKQKK